MFFRHVSAIVLALGLTDAVPSFAADALVPIAAFVQDSKFRLPRLSPDGKHLAMRVSVEFEGRDQKLLNIYELDGFKLISTIRLPIFELPIDFQWVSNTRLVLVRGKELGYLESPGWTGEILGTDLDGQNQEYLHGFYKRWLQRRGATALPDGGPGQLHSLPDVLNGQFFLQEYRWRGESSRTYIYDINSRNGIRKLVADLDQPNLSYLLQHDGKPRIANGTDVDNNTIVFVRDADRDNWQPMPPEKFGKVYQPLVFTPDDSEYFVLASKDGGPLALLRESMRGGGTVKVADAGAGNINLVQYGPSPYQPFAVGSNLGRPVLQYLDANSPEAKLHMSLSKQFPAQFVDLSSFSADASKVLFTVSSDREPGEFYIYDRASNKAEFLVAVRPGIDAARMAERRPIEFKSRDGLDLHGYLTLPPGRGERKLPLILLPHSGPQGDFDTWFFDADAQFLASRGYGVLQVNYRGSGGRGENFKRGGDLQWSTGMLRDLIDGVRWVQEQGISDPARVCVFGVDYGAYAAMMTTILEPDMFKCAVGFAGFYDLPMLASGDSAKHSLRVRNYYAKSIGTDLELLKNNSPVNLADKIKVPVLLVHGDQDKTTPKEQAEAMRDALTRAHKPFEWMMVPKEGHGFYAEKNRIAFYEKLEAFLAKNLGP